jgi:uroporphyrinogen decarboxylase
MQGVQPEVCPYYIWVDEELVAPLSRHFGEDQFLGEGTRTFAGSYTAMVEIKALPVEDHGDWFVDEYGVHYRRGSTLHVEQPALLEPTLAGYEFPDLTSDEHFEHLDAWIEENSGRFRIVQLGMLFFERTWGMRGMENILMDLHLEPKFVEDLLDGLAAVCAGVIDRLLDKYGDRIDAVGITEDYGSERALLMSPDHWRRFIKPRLAQLCAQIHRGGKRVYIHSCGHITPIIPDLVEVGADMLQPIQPEAMDVFELKRRFGQELCLMGGISTQKTLPYGTPQEVRREVQKCLKHMAVGGRYVMAPSKPILPGVPLENAIALIEACVRQSGP